MPKSNVILSIVIGFLVVGFTFGYVIMKNENTNYLATIKSLNEQITELNNELNNSQNDLAKANKKIDKLKEVTSISEFMKSPEGRKLEVASRNFAKAYFSGDVEEMKKYTVASNYNSYDLQRNDLYSKIEYLILRGPNKISDDKINLEYEFNIEGIDSLTYLSLEMEKVNGEWKVKWWGLQK